MKQLADIADIIEATTNEGVSLPVILRKVLVLSYHLRNKRLTSWVTAELDGYATGTELPDYRIIRTIAYGTFSGPFGSIINNKSLPGLLLKPEHRDFANKVFLRDSIAKIDATAAAKNGGRMPWPPDLVMLYQADFIEDHALVEAWLELPRQIFVGILDAVRTRTLQFVLELGGELGAAGDDLANISAAVEKTVTNNIYGGNNVIGGSNHRFSQTGSMTVGAGDQTALTVALAQIGFNSAEVAELLGALKQDKSEEGHKPGIGKRAAAWLEKIGAGIGNAALSVGTDVGKIEAARAITGFLGLS